MKKYQIYILNLKRHKKRRKHIISELKKQNIRNYEFVDAIDGNRLKKSQLDLMTCKNEKIFNPKNTNMSAGQVACALSHIKIYKKFLNSNFELALIFEDDAKFLNKFTEKLKKFILKNFKYESQIVLLGKLIEFYKNPIDRIKSHEFVEVTDTWGSHSYFINRKAAESIILFNYPVKTVADHFFIFRIYCKIKIFGLNPFLTTQDQRKFKSSIPNTFNLNKVFNWKIYFHRKKNRILKKRLKKLISHYD
ncbi:glycosyltransferase family 25 protein [Candidatus Pelagibacter sp.]|nr:glycosyltransferase family 25 protein [Candidatus Pelagibacter sp.]